MSAIKEILIDTIHRPYEIPAGDWLYYQEWNRVLFLHWEIPFELLRNAVPSYLNIDRFDGKCYISLVAFTMEKIRPRYLPSIRYISDFDEINIRTYVDNNQRKGVYFLNIESGKPLSTFIAKAISGLPYENSNINRTGNLIESVNNKKGFGLKAAFSVEDVLKHKSSLDRWLTERYALYLEKGSEFFRYDIHHKEWELKRVSARNINVNYEIGDINLSGRELNFAHYSEGIKVIAWKRQRV